VSIANWRKGHREEAQRLALIVIGVLAATAIVYVGWTAFQSGRGLVGWKSPIQGHSDHPVVGSPVDEIFSTSFTGLQLINDFYLPPQLGSTWFTLWVRVLAFLAAAAPLLLLAVTRKGAVERWLAAVALLGMISYPMIVELQVYTSQGRYFPGVVSRYGMSTIPLLIACLAMVAQRRGLHRWMLTGVGIGTVVTLTSAAGLISG